MIKKLLFTFFAASCLVQSASAVIIHSATYSKAMPDGTTQYIHLFGDFHDKVTYEKLQKEEFITALRHYNPADILVITEDQPYNNVNFQKAYRLVPQRLCASLENSFLFGLTWLCDEKKIPTCDVEFRESTNKFTNVTIADYFDMHFDPIVQEVKDYNDSPTLNDYYAEVLKRIDLHERPALDQFRPFVLTPYTIKIIPDQFIILATHELIDARILHQIHLNQHKKHIFVCVGNAHKYNIETILQRLQYQELHNTCTTTLNRILELARNRDKSAHAQLEKFTYDLPINILEYFKRFNSIKDELRDHISAAAAASADYTPAIPSDESALRKYDSLIESYNLSKDYTALSALCQKNPLLYAELLKSSHKSMVHEVQRRIGLISFEDYFSEKIKPRTS